MELLPPHQLPVRGIIVPILHNWWLIFLKMFLVETFENKSVKKIKMSQIPPPKARYDQHFSMHPFRHLFYI